MYYMVFFLLCLVVYGFYIAVAKALYVMTKKDNIFVFAMIITFIVVNGSIRFGSNLIYNKQKENIIDHFKLTKGDADKLSKPEILELVKIMKSQEATKSQVSK